MTRFLAIASACLVIVGCEAKLSDQRTITLPEPGEIEYLIVDKVDHQREIKASATANNPIDLFIYLDEDRDEAERFITLSKLSDIVLDRAEGTPTPNVAATIPPGKDAMIMIRSNKPNTDVELSLSE